VTNAQSSRAVLAGTMEDAVTRPAGHEETGALSNSPVEWDNEGRASRIVQPPQMNIEASPQSQGRRENAAAMTNLDIAQSKPHGQEVWDEKLLRAAQLGLSEELVEALAHGADAKKLDEHGYTPLMHACVAGSLACVEALIDVSDAKAKTAFGHTALMFAARSCPEAVERLIPLSSPRSLSRDGESALMAAIGAKQAQSARLLLPVSNLKQKNQDGLNALAQAVRAGEEEMVELLLDGSDLGARDAKGRDALMIAADMGRMALVQRLAPLSDPRAANEEGESAFLLALKGGHDAVALWLLPRSDIHAKNEYGMDALMLAAACCQPETAQKLLDLGLDPKAQDLDMGDRALGYASSRVDGLEMVRLLSPLSDIGARNRNGANALVAAATQGNAEVIELLLAAGMSPLADDGQFTPLHCAVRCGKIDAVKILAKVSDLDARAPHGLSAEEMARSEGQAKCLDELLQERARRLAAAERQALGGLVEAAKKAERAQFAETGDESLAEPRRRLRAL
jgi:ankyrin repeat protein